MTHPALTLTSTSGTVWHLTPVRPLAPQVQLVHHGETFYVLKSIRPPASLLPALIDDAHVWKSVCAADATNVLRLFDVVVENAVLYYIMEYCPAGTLASLRPERAALRCVAALSSALYIVHTTTGKPHANVSADHVLIDSSGVVKLAGWGVSRVRRLSNPKRNVTERDDVRAMGGVLFEMLYGKRFDVVRNTIPNASHISPPVCALLNTVLPDKRTVPSLMVFRYDLAAARNLVPIATPALPPVQQNRTEMLNQDLNSIRGQTAPAVPRQRRRSSSPHTQLPPPSHDHAAEVSAAHPPRVRAPSPTQTPLVNSAPPVRLQRSQSSPLHLSSDHDVEQFIRKITSGDLNAPFAEDVDALLDAIPTSDDLPEQIFKIMFRIPISKNPLVAFKAISIMHRLLSEGPAKMTALAISNDGFLNWVETAWSRERIQNKPGNAHTYTYCFVSGEISWYTSLLRRRVDAHGKYAQVFSTHWIARSEGLASLQNRRETFRLILEILEKASTLLRKLISANDPAASVKHSAIPVLVSDIAKTYNAICWLYATAESGLQPELRPELEVAHVAAKQPFDAIRSKPQFASLCSPNTLLNLPRQAPTEFDVNQLLAYLRKKKKRKKLRATPRESEKLDDETEVKGTVDSKPVRTVTEKRSRSRPPMQPSSSPKSEKEGPQRKEHRLNGVAHPDMEMGNGSMPGEKGVPRNGMRSNGIRKAPLSRHSAFRSQGASRSSGSDEKMYAAESGSDSSETDVESEDEAVRKRSTRTKPKKQVDTSSESESESEEGAPVKVSKKKKLRAKSKKKAAHISADVSKTDTTAKGTKGTAGLKKAKKRVDEKTIPFDKEHPKRRGAKKKPAVDEEYTGGSKEALEAAARGQKTPQMNPKFEVAPYEVHFGPQIGSGGFGVVYKAKFRNETVAVKKIHSHALSNSASVMEFQSEVAVLCTLTHPNILRFVGACTRAPNLMIITEFMQRGTLFDLLHQSDTRVTWPMRKKFALDTCKGMRYLHDSKLLHRDLKSSNLMLDKDYNCKVGDFGLTRISHGPAAIQMTGQCGTFQYMAVEVLANKPYSEKADVFSFGILLWEMVSRKLPYFGMQPMQVGIAVLQRSLRPTIPSNCPAPLARLMRLCWDDNPDRRPSFAQLVSALDAMPE